MSRIRELLRAAINHERLGEARSADSPALARAHYEDLRRIGREIERAADGVVAAFDAADETTDVTEVQAPPRRER